MNLQEIITAKVPGAVYTEAGDGMFTIPVEQFHDLARYLHDDPALRFDFLRSLTGMDWGEEGLGAVYHLESTATGENVVLKVLTPSREQCGLPTVSLDIVQACLRTFENRSEPEGAPFGKYFNQSFLSWLTVNANSNQVEFTSALETCLGE